MLISLLILQLILIDTKLCIIQCSCSVSKAIDVDVFFLSATTIISSEYNNLN